MQAMPAAAKNGALKVLPARLKDRTIRWSRRSEDVANSVRKATMYAQSRSKLKAMAAVSVPPRHLFNENALLQVRIPREGRRIRGDTAEVVTINSLI